MVYINRIRPHDTDIKRREYALHRADFLDGKRKEFINWCLNNNKTQEEMNQGLSDLDTIVSTWRDVADQSAID